jgi:hypothetical protein
MIPQLIEDLLLLPQAVSHEAGWLLAAGCDLLLLRRSMDQLGGSSMRMILDLSGRCAM